MRVCCLSVDVAADWGVEQRAGRLADSDELLFRQHGAVTRRKRNILFPSGVKLCSQETLDQAAANHLSYFHLRGEITAIFNTGAVALNT